jgi:glycosyltransferase involved in cell wall biosynthesis
MIGFSASLKMLRRIYKNRKLLKRYTDEPTVTVMSVAHNEEKVIHQKLENIIKTHYPKDKLEILVTSDNSTDQTNDLVRQFIADNPTYNIRLYEVKERKGKTNAQNEGQKTVTSDILVMTDANSMFEPDAVRELVSSFVDEQIAYVTGRLVYTNDTYNEIANSENTYWKSELKVRETESNIYTITAGNGAIYACRNKDYVDFAPIRCHDGNMPKFYAMHGRRAIFNPEAVAYEKAGEVIEDEFKRKIRMNRNILSNIAEGLSCINIFKYGWYSYFYFGHRTCRNLLWAAHLLVLLSSIWLWNFSFVYSAALILQCLFYGLSLINLVFKVKNKLLNMIAYYTMTIIAQWVGVYKCITGKSKPFWEKAESTR